MSAQLNMFEVAELAELHASFPARSDRAACIAFYRARFVDYDAACMRGDTEAVLAARKLADDFVTYLHGDDSEGCFMDCVRDLEEATKADGVPLWGQSASFELEVMAIPVRIEIEGLLGLAAFMSVLPHFSINVVNREKRFFSETGYRSCFSSVTEAIEGMTIDVAVRTYIEGYAKREMKRGLVMVGERHIRPAVVSVDDDEEDDDEVCDGCGVALAQLDSYHVLPCGVHCDECAESHAKECPECSEVLEEEYAELDAAD